MRLFFYGSLLDQSVRARVLGPLARHLTLEPAHLDGWRRGNRRGFVWPVVRRCAGGRVEGVLTAPLSGAALRLLARYEGTLYRRRTVYVRRRDGRRIRASVFVPEARGR